MSDESMQRILDERIIDKIIETIAPMAKCDFCGLMWDQSGPRPDLVWIKREIKWMCGKCKEAE